MELSLNPSLCPSFQLAEFLQLAKDAGFSAVELCRTHSESSPVHPEVSVRMVRQQLREAGLQLSGFNIRPLTGRKADSDGKNGDDRSSGIAANIQEGKSDQKHLRIPFQLFLSK